MAELSDVDRMWAVRDAVLRWLYLEKADGNTNPFLNAERIAKQVSWRAHLLTQAEVDEASNYLKREGFLKGTGSWGGGVVRPAITPLGEQHAERGISVRGSLEEKLPANVLGTATILHSNDSDETDVGGSRVTPPEDLQSIDRHERELYAAFLSGDSEAGRTLAEVLERRGDGRAAERVLSDGMNRRDLRAARQLADLYRRQGRSADAFDTLRIASDFGDSASSVDVARTLVEQGDLDQAERLLRWTYDRSDDVTIALLLAEVLKLKGDHDSAIRLLRNVAFEDTRATVQLAKILEEQGELAEAEGLLEAAFENGDVHAGRPLAALIERRRGDLTSASNVLKRAFQFGDQDAGMQLAEFYERQGDLSQYERTLRQLLKNGDLKATIALIDLAYRSGDAERIDKEFARADAMLDRRYQEGDNDAGLVRASLLRRRGRTTVADRIEREIAANSDASQPDGVDSPTGFKDQKRQLVIPAVTGDHVDGDDQLGIDNDARALAALISSRRLEPPLAIGLYGEWGSGKTFFMKRIEANIRALGRREVDREQFHKEVGHVWFNAWHYARGDIWASLLEHIFRELSPRTSEAEKITSAAFKHVTGMQQVAEQAATLVAAAQERVDSLSQSVSEAEKKHEEAVARINEKVITDVWGGIRAVDLADENLRGKLEKATRALGLEEVGRSAQDLASAADEVLELGSKARTLATIGGRKSPLAWAVYGALTIGGLGIGAATAIGDWGDPVSAVVLQMCTAGGAAATWIKRQSTVARELLEPALRVQKNVENRLAEERRKVDADLESLKQQASSAELSLAAAREMENDARASLAAAQREKDDLSGDQLLKRYLAERAGSGEYDRYLGVVALAHRDLRDLSEFLSHAATDTPGESQHLNRIVLYIDDLDRCDPETVVNVLDAVHLLLALPIFAVVVGVDPRWLMSSLRRRHSELLSGDVATTAADYLEKIFHLTYTLQPMDNRGTTALLRSSVNFMEKSSPDNHPLAHEHPASSFPTPEINNSRLIDEDRMLVQNIDDANAGPTSGTYAGVAEGLSLTPDDLDTLLRLAPLTATSPRRAKRFISTYLVVRARVLSDPHWREMLNSASGDSLALMVGLSIGLPITMQTIKKAPNTVAVEGPWVKSLEPEDLLERDRLEEFISGAGHLTRVSMKDLLHWEPIVKPYTGLHSNLLAVLDHTSQQFGH